MANNKWSDSESHQVMKNTSLVEEKKINAWLVSSLQMILPPSHHSVPVGPSKVRYWTFKPCLFARLKTEKGALGDELQNIVEGVRSKDVWANEARGVAPNCPHLPKIHQNSKIS